MLFLILFLKGHRETNLTIFIFLEESTNNFFQTGSIYVGFSYIGSWTEVIQQDVAQSFSCLNLVQKYLSYQIKIFLKSHEISRNNSLGQWISQSKWFLEPRYYTCSWLKNGHCSGKTVTKSISVTKSRFHCMQPQESCYILFLIVFHTGCKPPNLTSMP